MKTVLNLFIGTAMCGMMTAPMAHASGELALGDLANKSFFCEGGNESAGRDYVFQASGNSIERVDQRFPNEPIHFELGNAVQGTLGPSWSFETLSEVDGERLHLYERVSLRTAAQNKHIYRTYELYSQANRVFMVLYDGVNGARDWRLKTTRDCGSQLTDRGKIVKGGGKRYWSTTFSN